MPMTDLRTELLNRGQFCGQITEKIQEVARSMRAVRQNWEETEKLKGKVVATIELQELSKDSNDVRVKTSVVATLPTEPKHVSLATMGGPQGATLRCNVVGTVRDHPRQEHMDFPRRDGPEADAAE